MIQSDPPICNYEGSDYQSTFWEQGGRAYEDQVEAVALQRLLPHSGKLLLELGAGAGRNTLRYKQFDRIVLLDYSLTQLQQAQAKLGLDHRFIYVAANIYKLPFIPALFDAVTMIRVLHHLTDVPKAFNQIRQALKQGAVFILEFSNKQNLKAIIRYVLRRQTWNPFTPEPVEFVNLNFDFNPFTIRTWLCEAGFHIDRQLTVSHFRVGVLKRWVPLWILVSLDSLAQWTGNWWQLTPSVFVRAKANGQTEVGVGSKPISNSSPGGLFRCPNCGNAPLVETSTSLNCSSCGRQWSIQAGIYDFRYQ